MKIILADVNPNLIDAWVNIFNAEPDLDVHIYPGSIFDLNVDSLVSPANSYGFMDGSLDLAISMYFGWHVQDRVQHAIKTKHHGELLVGLAEVVKTDHHKIPYLVCAPTMRVPMLLGADTINPYLATRATLLELTKHPDIKSVAFPGLGTGVGAVPPLLCATQMRDAIKEVIQPQFPNGWKEAQRNHLKLLSRPFVDLQKKSL